MSFYIDNAFTTKYQADFHLLASQTVSRLTPFSKKNLSVVGSMFTVDILSTATGVENRARHSDLTYDNIENTRRVGIMQDKVVAELIDKEDKLKMLIDPTNAYSMRNIEACNRFKDTVIIRAALGSAQTMSGNNTFGSAALPAEQKIANGGTSLTIAKLRKAKKLLDNAEMDDSDYFRRLGTNETKQDPYGNANTPSYVIVCTADEIDNLLGTTEATSVDYNSVKALVSGSVNTFMGFLFVRLSPTYFTTAGSVRSIFCYAPRALEHGVGQEPSALVERIPQKNAWQVMADMSVGAVRAEDKGVVQIDVVVP